MREEIFSRIFIILRYVDKVTFLIIGKEGSFRNFINVEGAYNRLLRHSTPKISKETFSTGGNESSEKEMS